MRATIREGHMAQSAGGSDAQPATVDVPTDDTGYGKGTPAMF